VRTPATPRGRQRGVALILTLWAFMVLGVLALDFGRWMREDAMAGANFAEETQGYYAAYAGMQTALWKASARLVNGTLGDADDGGGDGDAEGGDDEDEELVQSETGTFHGVGYRVEVRPECGRIPINRIAFDAGKDPPEPDDREFLKRLITNLLQGGNATEGMDQRAAEHVDEVVDSIIDWVDRNQTPAGPMGAENKWYRANRGYTTGIGFFLTPEELLKVRGVTPDLFYGTGGRPGLRDVISVYCGLNESDTFGEGLIDGLSVDPKVLQVLLPSVQPEELADLKSMRDSGDRVGFVAKVQSLLGADPVLSSKFEFGSTHATLVAVTARADTARERNQSAIGGVFTLAANDVPEPLVWYDRAPFTGPMPRTEMAEGGE
jgi:hypothetical protein